MSWPMSQDFNEAIQNPKIAFSDLDLKEGEPVVGAHGMPLPRSGNFADVYQVRGFDGRDWAVKCFTRPVTGLGERYAAISEALAEAKFPFSVGFEFLAEGIRVGGIARPVVKMEWVEGLLFNQVVRENADRPTVLVAFGQMWVKLCKRLRDAGVAHADLQHGNVLLVPGSRQGAYGLKLIDYDGMYVPALANTPSGESGHPSYQHPARAKTRAYSPDVDRFPHLVVATALKGLAVCGPTLWEKYGNGDNLLFTEDDFRKPSNSKVMRELWQTNDAELQAFVGRLAIACGRAIPQTPWLDQLAPDGDPTPLEGESRREAASALGIAPPVRVAPPPSAVLKPPSEVVKSQTPEPQPVASKKPEESQWADVELVQDEAPREKKKSRKAGKGSSQPLFIVGGVLLLVAGVAAAVIFSGGKPKPDTAQKNPDDTKTGTPDPGEGPKPKDKTSDPLVPKPKDKNPDHLAPKPGERWEARQVWSTDLGPDLPAPVVTFTSDSKFAAIISRTKPASMVLDAATGKPVPIPLENVSHLSKAVAIDGGKFAVLTTGGMFAVDFKTGQGTLLRRVPAFMSVSPDARYMAVGDSSNLDPPQPFRLRHMDGKKILDLDLVRGSVYFTADSSRILVAEWSGLCRWFKLPSGEADGEFKIPSVDGPGASVSERRVYACSSDGSLVLYEGGLPNVAGTNHILEGRSGRVLRSVPGRCIPYFGNLSADGSLAVVIKGGAWNKNRSTEVINTATGEYVLELQTPQGSETLHPTLLPDGSGFLALLGPSNTMVRYDFVRPGEPIKPKDPITTPRPAAGMPVELLEDPYPKTEGFASIAGWKKKGTDLPMVIANSSDNPVLIPESKVVRLAAHSIGVHPSAKEFVGVVWKSPITGKVKLNGQVKHLDRSGGNGITWRLELRRGETSSLLGEYPIDLGVTATVMGPAQKVVKGDSFVLLVDCKDGDHFHDLAELALTFTEVDGADRVWNLSADVADTITAGNPHADKYGNKDTWSFVRTGPPTPSSGVTPKDPFPVVGPLDLRVRWTAPLNGGKAINRLQISSDAELVFPIDPKGVFLPLDGKTGQPRKEFSGLAATGSTSIFSLDRGRVASFTAKPDEFQLWDATGKDVGKIVVPDIPPGSGNAKGLRTVLSPDGRYVAVGRAGNPATDNPDVPFRVFDVSTNKAVVTATWKGGSALFTADSARVLVAEWAGRVRWFKLPSGEPDGEFNLGQTTGNRRHMFYGISADGSAIAYNGPAEMKEMGAMSGVLDGKTGKLTRQFRKHFSASEVAISADGRRAALILEVEDKACTFEVVDVSSGEAVGRIRVVGRAIPSVNLSSDGRVLVLHDPEADKVHLFEVPERASP